MERRGVMNADMSATKQFTGPSMHGHAVTGPSLAFEDEPRNRVQSRRVSRGLSCTTSSPTSTRRFRLVRLIWPFVAIVVLLLALGTASLQVIRGVRAYISAESVWSNAQKAAVEALEQYAQTRNEDYFDRYVEESARRSRARAPRASSSTSRFPISRSRGAACCRRAITPPTSPA